ncbi:MAG: hypothetical protein ACP5G8_07850 [Athalassotoga sp.]
MKQPLFFAKNVFVYGSFAKPFLNMVLDGRRNPWNMYFMSVRYEWRNDHVMALRKAKQGLLLSERVLKKKECSGCSKYEKGKTIFYLLLIKYFSILNRLKDPESERIYIQIKCSYSKMSKLPRQITATTLINYYSFAGDNINSRRPRAWSKDYQNPSTKVFLLLGVARNLVKDQKLSGSISYFSKAFKIARTIPHPTGIIESLNAMAWYMKETHAKIAYKMAKKAVWFAGWYREDIGTIFFALDTLLECQKICKDYKLFDNAIFMTFAYSYLLSGKGAGTREHYRKSVDDCNKFLPVFDISTYENTVPLRNYLRDYIPNISNAAKTSGITTKSISVILNGKVKKIKGNTIRKVIKGLDIKVNFDTPFEIINENTKMFIEDEFKKSMDRFEKISPDERLILFLSTYMSYIERRKTIPSLSQKDVLSKATRLCKNDIKAFENYMSINYETMKFVSDIFDAHPFIEGRKALARSFLAKMSPRIRKRFIKAYLNLDEGERRVIDRFARDYIRYDIRWEMRIEVPNEMEEYVKLFHLKRRPAALAYWSYDDEKGRERLVRVLGRVRDGMK